MMKEKESDDEREREWVVEWRKGHEKTDRVVE